MRTNAQRGALRALWFHRDEIASKRDVAVHRIAAQTGELSLSSRHPVGEGAMWVRVLRLDKPA